MSTGAVVTGVPRVWWTGVHGQVCTVRHAWSCPSYLVLSVMPGPARHGRSCSSWSVLLVMVWLGLVMVWLGLVMVWLGLTSLLTGFDVVIDRFDVVIDRFDSFRLIIAGFQDKSVSFRTWD